MPQLLLAAICCPHGELGISGGINPLFEAAKRHIADLSRSQVATCLANQGAHSLEKAARKHFIRNGWLWQRWMHRGRQTLCICNSFPP